MSEELVIDEFVVDEYAEPEGYYYANGEEVIDPDLEKGLRYGDILNGKLVWIYEPFDEERLELIRQEKIKEQSINELPQFMEDYDNVVCELYEQMLEQQDVISEQDSAICALYEMIL